MNLGAIHGLQSLSASLAESETGQDHQYVV
jgi:hypothetical protein